MDQTAWVMNVLDDSNRRSIEYANRFWLRQHVQEMNIRVCVEDCEVSIEELTERYGDEKYIFIQNGKEIKSKRHFNEEQEALMLLKGENMYFVFLYTPKRTKK